MLLKMECHLKWSIIKNEMSVKKMSLNVIKNGMSQNGISLKMECH